MSVADKDPSGWSGFSRPEDREHLEFFEKFGPTTASGVATATNPLSETGLAGWWQRVTTDQAVLYAFNLFLTHRLLLFALGAFFALLAPLEPPLGDELLRDVSPYFWGPAFFLLSSMAALGYQLVYSHCPSRLSGRRWYN